MGRSNGAGLMAGRNDAEWGGSDLELCIPNKPHHIVTRSQVQAANRCVVRGWLSRDELLSVLGPSEQGDFWADIGRYPISNRYGTWTKTDAGTYRKVAGSAGAHPQQGEKAHNMECWLHPTYKTIRKPRVQCGICWLMWNRHVDATEARRGRTRRSRPAVSCKSTGKATAPARRDQRLPGDKADT